MINKEECKKCFYGSFRSHSVNADGTVNMERVCDKNYYQTGSKPVDELDVCPLEVEKVSCKCVICDKTDKVTKKKATGLYVHVCDECKSAIKYVKELMIRHDDT